MKKLLILFLLFPVLLKAQQTYWSVSPAGWSSISNPAFRFKADIPDSTNNLLIFNPLTGKYNQIYTATEGNKRFLKYSDTASLIQTIPNLYPKGDIRWLRKSDSTYYVTPWELFHGNNNYYGVNTLYSPTYINNTTLGIQPGANLGFVSSLSTTHGHWQWTSSDIAGNTSSLEATFWNTSNVPVSGLKFLPDNNGTIKDYSGVSFAKSTDIQKFLPSDSTKIAYIDSTGKIALSPSFLFKQGVKSGVPYQKQYLGYPKDSIMKTKDGGLMLWGRAGGIDPRVVTVGYGASTGLSKADYGMWNVGGTIDAPTATANNTIVGEVYWAPYDGVSEFREGASIRVITQSTTSPTNAQSNMYLNTTPFGSVTPLPALTLNSDQSVQATNLFTAVDLKASGAAAKVSTDAHLAFPDKAIIQWSTPSSGSAFIQGTQEATTLAGRGLWNLSNAYFDGTNWRQPRGTGVGSYLSSGSYENGFVWRYAPPNGVDGGTISPVNVMQLNNAGALTLNYDATHSTTFTPSSAGNLLIAPNGTSLNINSNVGIGTSTLPLNTFEVTKSVAGALGPVFSLINPNTTTTNSQVQLKFNPSNSTARYAYINSTNDGANNVSLAFGTGSGASITDKLTISGAGLINLPLLTASKPVYLDASKNLTSTGPGTTAQMLDAAGNVVNSLPSTIANNERSATATLTNKTIAVGSNNITGTAGSMAKFNNSTGNLEAAIANTDYLPVNNAVMTGTPTAPTAIAGTNTTQVATTAFVSTAVNGYVPTSRTITTGYGFTGGGDLTANRTLTADTTTSTGLVSKSRLATNLTGYRKTTDSTILFNQFLSTTRNFLAPISSSSASGFSSSNGLSGASRLSIAFGYNIGGGTASMDIYSGSLYSSIRFDRLIYSDGTNGLSIVAPASFTSGGNTITWPAKTGTVALIPDLASYLRLTASGTGSATTISIAHGITGVSSTSKVFVTPKNAASAGFQYVTTDATNVNIVYSVAPASGTNNLSYDVEIKP